MYLSAQRDLARRALGRRGVLAPSGVYNAAGDTAVVRLVAPRAGPVLVVERKYGRRRDELDETGGQATSEPLVTHCVQRVGLVGAG